MPVESTPNSSDRPKKPETEPTPIIKLPAAFMKDNDDQTGELRALVEELRRSVQDSVEEAKRAERENENLSRKLAQTAADLSTSREREKQLRAQLLEANARDKKTSAAPAPAPAPAPAAGPAPRPAPGDSAGGDRHIKTITELQRRLDVLTREQDSAGRQREAAARQLESVTRAAESTAAQLLQAQNQIVSIRLARDTTQAQNRALTDKLAKAEDQLAELNYTHETEEQILKQSAATIDELRAQLTKLGTDRDALSNQITQLNAQADADRQKILDLSAQQRADAADDDLQDAALAEARNQIRNLTQERDAARERAHELTVDLTQLHEQLNQARNAQAAATTTAANHSEALRQIEVLSAEISAQRGNQDQWTTELSENETLRIELMAQLADAQHAREQALTTIHLLEAQIETLRRERDAIAAKHAEEVHALEMQMAAVIAHESDLEKAIKNSRTSGAPDHEQMQALAKRSESHRLAAIDLAARLEVAQSELVELTASLAEARLQLKFATVPSAKTVNADGTESDLATPAAAREGKLTEREARSTINAMRSSYQIFSKNTSDQELLSELYQLAHGFSERAQISGMLALQQLSAAFAALINHLRDIPESINPSTSHTLQQTIEFMAALVRDRNLTRLKDPTKTRIYVVDDDRESSDMIAMGLEMAMLHSLSSATPAVALEELATGLHDLIYLDVDLPEMDGFELCSKIRQLENHAHTPIVIITGHNSADHRAKAARHGANDFVTKPFNLHELVVKSLMLLLANQLAAPIELPR